MKLPEFLSKAIAENTTSLGDHPAFPPEDEDTFVSSLIRGEYSSVMKNVDTDDRRELSNQLNKLIDLCKKEEDNCKEALEKLCSDILATIFKIPEDTIHIDGKLVDECDMSRYRLIPDSTPDFEFEDIEQMQYLSDKIYQRRMIDAIMTGMSIVTANTYQIYANEIVKINPKLLNIYMEIHRLNNALMYNIPDSIKLTERSNSGKVTVTVGDSEDIIHVEAEGVIFPILLEFSIKGLLEVASLKGLPDDTELADYILGKADYRLAENWDMRIGIPIWKIILSVFEKCDITPEETGLNYLIMEMSRLEPPVFNKFIQNVLKKTRLGYKMANEIVLSISRNKEQDDFDRYIKVQNDKYSINDNEEYTAEELLSEIEH